jgi:hypothetical protein
MIEAIFNALALLIGSVYIAVLIDAIPLLFRGRTKMPVAVVTEDQHKFELKSLEGAYIVVREMSYGEKIMRSGMTGAMKLLKDNKKSDYVGELSMETQKITLWDFANLIIDHNLEDTDGRKLNFKVEQDVRKLSSKVGEEVGTRIDEVNNFEDIDEGN